MDFAGPDCRNEMGELLKASISHGCKKLAPVQGSARSKDTEGPVLQPVLCRRDTGTKPERYRFAHDKAARSAREGDCQ
jgi:hypothetical protein